MMGILNLYLKTLCIETTEQAIALAKSPQEVLVATTFAAYDRSLKAYNAVDFDDLIRIPTMLFKNNEAVRTKWQKNTRYLLVDEYQDTNTSQYELVKIQWLETTTNLFMHGEAHDLKT